MKIIIDQKKVERYRKIGQYTSIAALVILLGGFVIAISQIISTFKSGADAAANLDERMLTYSYIAMFIGLILTQVSLYFGNRWGRKDSVDVTISNGLKGLDDRYTLYHYTAPVPHLLVGPAGMWVISPMYQTGTIRYERKRYRQSGVRFFSRLFGQEGIGRPDLDAASYLQDMKRFLAKNVEDKDLIEPQVMIVFTDPKTQLEVEDAPYPTLGIEKLKDFIRRRAKEQMLPSEKLQPLRAILPQAE